VAIIGFVVNAVIAFVLNSGGGHGHSHGGLNHHSINDDDDHSSIHEGLLVHSHDESDHDDHDHDDHSSSSGHSHDSHGHDHHEKYNINVRAAFIHIIGDLAQSFGVIIASIIILYRPDLTIVDPICTCLFALIVLMTTIGLIKESFHILMEATPKNIDSQQVILALQENHNVVAVHDLHIWSISTEKTALSVHVKIKKGVEQNQVLFELNHMLSKQFKLKHSTIQIEI
jgi:zinc transporter 2